MKNSPFIIKAIGLKKEQYIVLYRLYDNLFMPLWRSVDKSDCNLYTIERSTGSFRKIELIDCLSSLRIGRILDSEIYLKFNDNLAVNFKKWSDNFKFPSELSKQICDSTLTDLMRTFERYSDEKNFF